MAITAYIRTKKTQGETPLYFRVRSKKYGVDIKLASDIVVDIEKWNKSQSSLIELKRYRSTKAGSEVYDKISKIESVVNERINPSITAAEVHKAINSILYPSNNNTMDSNVISWAYEYLNIVKGEGLKRNTICNMKMAINSFERFVKDTGEVMTFESITILLIRKLTSYMKDRYSVNTIACYLKNLKTILNKARIEGITEKRYDFIQPKYVDTESIYLTLEDLDKINAVNLNKMPKKYAIARDIFMIGVYTAQRVSDYNNINKDSIKHYTDNVIVKDIATENGQNKEVLSIKEREYYTIEIIQKKTGKRVIIPAKSELMDILNKYDFNIPKIDDCTLNLHIKEIAKMAGLDERCTSTMQPKYELISSHTARRTGATLMYLAGIDAYDICSITGHSSIKMLNKYIKAKELEVAKKLISKYKYFD